MPHPDPRPANPRDEFLHDFDQASNRLLLERARLGLKLILAGIAVVFVGWFFISGGRLPLLSVCHALNFVVVALALRLLRDPGRPTFNLVVGFLAYAVTVVFTGVEGVLAGDASTPALILLGMAVGVPARRGFGMRLIEEALAYEIAGSITTLRFPDHGLRCDIAIPRPSSP